MGTSLEKIEKELNIPKELIIREGIQRFLEFELRNSRAEISKICIKYGIISFGEFWDSLEKGKVSEFDS